MSFQRVKRNRKRNREKGVALIVALFALMLLSCIAAGMMFMSSMETQVNGNYRDAQLAYFASQAGLEDARQSMRTSIAPPTDLPTTTNGQIVYITNPAAGETVAPWDPANKYFDYELCHENFPGLGLTNSGANIPCEKTAGTGIPSGSAWYTTVSSTDPYRNTNGALAYKWVRINLKTNSSTKPYYVDGGTNPATLNSQVCWDHSNRRELLLAGVPTPGAPMLARTSDVFSNMLITPATFFFKQTPADPPPPPPPGTDPSSKDKCQQKSINWYSVYLVTSMSVTPSGARRLTQYEISKNRFDIPAPASFTFAGPAAEFGAPSSAVFEVSGKDHCGVSDKPALGGYNVDVPTLQSKISGHEDQYPGVPAPVGNIEPALVTSSTNLTSVAELNKLVDALRQNADSYANLTKSPADPIPTNWGSTGHPRLTFVDGDVSIPDGATGLIVVTGNATLRGGSAFNGLLLVIGKGNLTKSGGGGTDTNYGAIFVANTKTNADGTLLTGDTPGPPTINFNGGGNSTITFDSCAVNQALAVSSYRVVSFRELAY